MTKAAAPRPVPFFMYCPHCEIHFSGSRGGTDCPYCGRPAEPSAANVPAEGGRAGSLSARIWSDTNAETLSEGGVPKHDSTATETPASEWSPGTLIAGKYEVVSRLGAGGFGTVYKVRHIFRKKYYALKTPHREFAKDESFRVRFEREIEAMERFVHADAVMIRDSGLTESSVPYYTMDFIEGESLKVVLRREKRLPVERALGIIRRVLRVLEVAHAHHIIHRDIKPDNILLTCVSGRETVKVLDFGVAKLLDLVGETGSVTKGMRVGTPKYMSPEQILGESLDARSDLFSLGIVFYEMVTGEHPFARVKDPVRVTAAILNRTPIPPRELVPEVPKAIQDHILWLLEKKAKKRPPSARAVIRHLGPLEDGVSRVEPVEVLDVTAAVPRSQARPLVLRNETSVGERRIFLFFAPEISFGRTNDPSRGVANDVIWRCLPCRSERLDPENWQRNLTISQTMGTLRLDGAAFVIEPAPHARYGISIGGVRSSRPARIQSDRFHISIGDKALELDGHRMLRSRDQPELDLSFLDHSRPAAIQPPSGIGYSEPGCLIDHVHFQRASNWPLHEYFFIYRQLRIGSSANVGLRLRAAGVEAVHAVVLFEKGEAFLLPLGGRVVARVRPAGEAGGSASDDGGGEELELPPHALLPLRPGLELILGEACLIVDAAADTYQKTV